MAQLSLLLQTGWHLALTGLPGLAAALYASRRGVRSVPALLALFLAGSGGAGLLGFWSYYGDRVLGETVSYLVPLGSLLLSAWCLYEDRHNRSPVPALGVPLALWALGTFFLVFLGFLHGGTDAPMATSAIRFSHQLPGDNTIPQVYATWFYEHSHHGMPPVASDWHFSDRPPLQEGYALLQRPFGWDPNGLHYEVMAIALQQLWIVGLWALLLAAGVGRGTRALTMVATLLFDLTIVNGFYVWPKMLAAAMLLGSAALLITPLWEEVRRSLWGAALVAALFGLALLAHGATVFGVIALLVVAAARGLPNWRWIGAALAVGMALMVPWFAYQTYGDPPGNRLTKWTLAGVSDPADHRGTLQAIGDSYGEAGFGGTLNHKVDNFVEMAAIGPTRKAFEIAAENPSLTMYVRTIRDVSFFYLLPSLWLLLVAPLVVAVGWSRRTRRPREWAFAVACMAVLAIGLVDWGLICFGNLAARTIIHFGSYLLPIIAVSAAVVGMRSVFPRLALGLVGLNALLGLAIYAPALDPPPGSSYSVLAAMLATASLAVFVAVATLGGRRRAQET